jgi:predicted lipid-binding transport protein (Tim44 family)
VTGLSCQKARPVPPLKNERDILYVNIDIIIYAVIAAFLIYRLNSVLGTRTGHERDRQNPFPDGDDAGMPVQNNVHQLHRAAPAAPPAPQYSLEEIVDAGANADGRVEQGLDDIAGADARFNPSAFIDGARKAFEYIVTAYARGDLAGLKPLLSPKLFDDFSAGVAAQKDAGHATDLTIHRIKTAKVREAHLGGLMAYVTVMYEVEETTVTRDAEGKTVAGDADSIITVKDVWTYTRDTRAADPNWMLIETGVAESAA